MASRFPRFPSEMIQFFRGLNNNNNREWFQSQKSVFEEKVKAPMTEMVEWVNSELVKFAPEHVTDPAKAIYRIYRDTRFSKDKTPYKTHLGAIFPRRGLEKHGGGAHYFHVSHQEFLIAGGAYMPGKDELLAIRRHIAGHYSEFQKLIGSKRLTSMMGQLQGDQLNRAPKGFSPDDPAVDALRNKQWYFYVSLEPKLATTPEFSRELIRRFRALQPFLEFLNAPILARIRDSRPDPALTQRAPSSRRR